MTSPLEFLEAAHKQAEETASAAGGDEWAVQQHPAETIAVYDSHGNAVVYDEGAPSEEQKAHIIANHPGAVLLRITAERKILAHWCAEPHSSDCWSLVRGDKPCDCGQLERIGGYVWLLAEAWGWAKEEQR